MLNALEAIKVLLIQLGLSLSVFWLCRLLYVFLIQITSHNIIVLKILESKY